jgi:hypothetical protein
LNSDYSDRLLAKALAWPVVVGGGLWYFRETIIANLPRVTRVGPVTLDPPPPQILPVIADSTSNEAIKRVEALVPPELLAEARKLIEASVPRNAQGEKIAEVQYLTTLAATITLVALFEKAYGTIWGSQLQLLQSLNSSPQSVERSKTFYERAAQDSPAAYQHYSFEQWIGFLIESVLITKSNDGQFAITLRGRGFLRFVVDIGYPLLGRSEQRGPSCPGLTRKRVNDRALTWQPLYRREHMSPEWPPAVPHRGWKRPFGETDPAAVASSSRSRTPVPTSPSCRRPSTRRGMAGGD